MERAAEISRELEEILRYREEILLLCLGFSRDASVAEDLCQDVYVKACRKLSTVRKAASLKYWLFSIARNICLDYGRRSRIVRFIPLNPGLGAVREDDQLPESRDADARMAELKAAVGRLPGKLREVFVLREYARLSYEDIARTLKIKEGTVMSRLHRGRRALFNSFGENRHDDAPK